MLQHPAVQWLQELLEAVVRYVAPLMACASLLFGVKSCRERDAALVAKGRFAYVADSIQRVERSYQYQAEQNQARADRWLHTADSLQQLRADVPTIITRIVAAAPLPRPALTGDTIRFEDDSIPYLVDHPVASWVGAASAHITHLETLVRDTIRTAWNTMALENRALRAGFTELQGANLNLDSLATSRLKNVNRLTAELARSKPSKWKTAGRVVEDGLAVYFGYRVGRGR